MLIPADTSAITPGALNRLFQSCDSGLPDVASVQANQLDGGYGWLALSFRLRLTWAGEGAANAPSTLVAKLPRPEAFQDAAPSARRMYRREAMFHSVAGPDAPLRIPKAWAAEIDEPTGAATMVFEDLGWMESVGDDETISVERVENAVMQLARLHARYWNSSELESMDWLAHPAVTGVDQVSSARFKEMWPALVKSGAYPLSPAQLRLGKLLGEKLDDVYRLLHSGPVSLVHADLHQENIFFDGEKAAFIDWQSAERANPAKDFAKLTASCLEPGTVQRKRPGLLESYAAELRANGVDGISMESLHRNVHLATCHYLAMMTFLSDARDFAALAANMEARTDFTTSRVIAACDSDELVAVVEEL